MEAAKVPTQKTAENNDPRGEQNISSDAVESVVKEAEYATHKGEESEAFGLPEAARLDEADRPNETQSAAQPNQPPIQANPENHPRVETQVNGMRIVVELNREGWLLPIAALVTAPGGIFHDALNRGVIDNVVAYQKDPGLTSQFSDLVNKEMLAAGEKGQNFIDDPLLVPLDEALSGAVLPNAPGGRGQIILTDLEQTNQPAQEIMPRFIKGLVRLAIINKLSTLALPLLGTGALKSLYGSENQVAGLMLDCLFAEADPAVACVTLLTVDETVLNAARLKFNTFNNNRAQPLLNDQPSVQDLLGIDAEIRALADTLLLREIHPPLAVGIMGGWGSGKSSVMQMIQQRMEEVCGQANPKGWSADPKDQAEYPFVGHVYAIPFNAWTYAKSNLWASLMQTIFVGLNNKMAQERGEAEAIDERDGISGDLLRGNVLWESLRRRKQAEIQELRKTEKELAERKVKREAANQTQQEDANKELGESAQRQAASVFIAAAEKLVGDQVKMRIAAVVDQDGKSTDGDVREAAEVLRSTAVTLARLKETIARSPWNALAIFGLALLFAYGVYVVNTLWDLSQIGRAISALAALVPFVMPVVRFIQKWNRQVAGLLDDYQKRLEDERQKALTLREVSLQKKRAEDERILKAQMEALSNQDVETKQNALKKLADAGNVAANDYLLELLEARVEQQRREVGPTAQFVSMLDFVRSRLNQADYISQLGLMHQVKRDFDELTDGLSISAGDDPETIQAKQALFKNGEPRVVLFIDDLDRCPPSRVVEVLEAVQLLLKTRIFIVVIGIDTRYVTLALEKKYKQILQHAGDPSGLDYIEKIIELPYQIRPVSELGLSRYLNSQMAFADPESPPIESGHAAPVAQGPSGSPIETRSDPDQGSEPDPTGQAKTKTETSLPPEVIKFSRDEFADLVACCKIVDLTPRSLKRLTNVLKLVKISSFRSSRRDLQAARRRGIIMMLALCYAYPEVMREVLIAMHNHLDMLDPSTTLIVDYLSGFPFTSEIQQHYGWELEPFLMNLNLLKNGVFGQVSLANLSADGYNLVRSFSFVGDPIIVDAKR